MIVFSMTVPVSAISTKLCVAISVTERRLFIFRSASLNAWESTVLSVAMTPILPFFVAVTAAAAVGKTCRDALAIICLSGLMLNLGQLLLSPILMNVHVSVTFPVMGMAVCFTMLAVTQLLVRGKELKDDNDLFV